MNAANRTTPAARNRAIARLRALTIGTTIAGVAAVGGFGTLAAVSYSGHSTAVTADVDSSTSTSVSSGTTTGTATATATPTATATIQPATSTITTTSGGGQVSSGGS